MALWGIAAAVLVAAALLAAWLLQRRRDHPPLDEAAAIAAATAALPGFTARQALLGDDRRTALVVGEHARVALVSGGRHTDVREVRWNAIRAVGGGLRVEAERGRGTFVPGIDVLDVRRAGDETWRRR